MRIVSEQYRAVKWVFRRQYIGAAAVLTFAVATGPTVAVFGLFDRIFLRPLPFPDPSRLVQVHLFVNTDPRLPQAFLPLSYGKALAERDEVFDGVAWVNGASVVRTSPSQAIEPLVLTGITSNAIDVLGTGPVLGRAFETTSLSTQPTTRQVLLTAAGSRRLGGSSALGTRWRQGPLEYVVVGILSEGFLLPSSRLLERLDGVYALGPTKQDLAGALITAPFARLARGVTLAQAQAAADSLEFVPWQAGGEHVARRATVMPLRSGMALLVGPYLTIMFVAAGLVFLVGCTNLAILLHAKEQGEARARGIRVALGAGLTDLVRLVAARAVVVCLGGAALAWLFYLFCRQALLFLTPPELRGFSVVGTDLRLLSLCAVGVVCALTFATVPAIQAARQMSVLSLLSRSSHSSRHRSRALSRSLLAVEVCLAAVVCTGAAITVPAFWQLWSQELGYVSDDLYIVTATHGWSRTLEGDHTLRTRRARAVAEAIGSQHPGSRVSVSEGDPLGGQPDLSGLWTSHGVSGSLWSVDESFIEVVGAKLASGRPFNNAEITDSAPVALLNESGVRSLWPGTQPAAAIGRVVDSGGVRRTIVGVVADFRSHPDGEIRPGLIVPLGSGEFTLPQSALYVSVRYPRSDLTAVTVRAALGGPLGDGTVRVQSVSDTLEPWLEGPRLLANLFGGLALVCLALVAVAAFALADFDVVKRLPELRIRMSLGASPNALWVALVGPLTIACAIGVGMGGVAVILLRDVYAMAGLQNPGALPFVASVLVIVMLAATVSALPLRRLRNLPLSTKDWLV